MFRKMWGHRTTFKCCSEISLTGLSEPNVDDGVWADKITYNLYVQISLGTLVPCKSTLYHSFGANQMLPLKSFPSAVTKEFYAFWCARRDANLLYIRPSSRVYEGGFDWRNFHEILYCRLPLKYLNLFNIGQKYGALYIKTEIRFIAYDDTKSV
jgi:hypothetical protein